MNIHPEATLDLDETEACAPPRVHATIEGTQNHVWTFNDYSPASIVPNPTHVFYNDTESPVTYTLQLEAENAWMCWCRESGHCGETESDRVLHSDVKADVPDSDLTESSLRGEFTWDYGDCNRPGRMILPRTFTAAGTDLVAQHEPTVVAEGGCTDTPKRHEVYPAVQLNQLALWNRALLGKLSWWQRDMKTPLAMTFLKINGAETVSGPELQRTFWDCRTSTKRLNGTFP